MTTHELDSGGKNQVRAAIATHGVDEAIVYEEGLCMNHRRKHRNRRRDVLPATRRRERLAIQHVARAREKKEREPGDEENRAAEEEDRGTQRRYLGTPKSAFQLCPVVFCRVA